MVRVLLVMLRKWQSVAFGKHCDGTTCHGHSIHTLPSTSITYTHTICLYNDFHYLCHAIISKPSRKSSFILKLMGICLNTISEQHLLLITECHGIFCNSDVLSQHTTILRGHWMKSCIYIRAGALCVSQVPVTTLPNMPLLNYKMKKSMSTIAQLHAICISHEH